MTCASCTTSITSALESHPSIQSAEINLLSSSGSVRHRHTLPPSEVVELIEDVGFGAEVMSSSSEPGPSATPEFWSGSRQLKTTFMIEGMTCASCSSAIDRALRQHEAEVLDVSIDVLGNKGVVIHTTSLDTEQIKNIIEDAGFGAELVGSEDISVPRKGDRIVQHDADKPRTVKIHVHGIFCDKCITAINAHLATLPLIKFTPVSISQPITTLTYVPQKPLTIRSILGGLMSLASEFEAEVVKCQLSSERSQQIQRKEVIVLATHLAVAILFALPTFVV